MSQYSSIPYHLSQFQNKSAFFFTYYGDIYFGSLWECPGYSDGFFIIRNDNLREVMTLSADQKSPNKFRELGWEIRDHRVIKYALEDSGNFRNSPIRPSHFSGEQLKQMFIFGAAASTFCVFGEAKEKFRKESYNPPMGFEIFDEKYNSYFSKYPGAKQSIPEFEFRNKDIEGCLDDEWSTYKNVYNPDVIARHINIQFYLQELFQGISDEVISKEFRHNLFSLFCKNLQKQLSASSNRAILVSFNYDTILDHFVEEFSTPFKKMDDYFDWRNRKMILFKPHGSSNWGWKFNQAENVYRSEFVDDLFHRKIEPSEIYYKLIGDISKTVEYGSWGLEGKYSLNKNLIQIISLSDSGSTYFPAMLLPYRDKDEFVMPYQMQSAMTSCFNQVDEIFLIGWKGNEERFNQKLKNHCHNLKKITIVNPRPQEVKNNLKKAGLDLTQYRFHEFDTFETFVISQFT